MQAFFKALLLSLPLLLLFLVWEDGLNNFLIAKLTQEETIQSFRASWFLTRSTDLTVGLIILIVSLPLDLRDQIVHLDRIRSHFWSMLRCSCYIKHRLLRLLVLTIIVFFLELLQFLNFEPAVVILRHLLHRIEKLRGAIIYVLHLTVQLSDFAFQRQLHLLRLHLKSYSIRRIIRTVSFFTVKTDMNILPIEILHLLLKLLKLLAIFL